MARSPEILFAFFLSSKSVQHQNCIRSRGSGRGCGDCGIGGSLGESEVGWEKVGKSGRGWGSSGTFQEGRMLSGLGIVALAYDIVLASLLHIKIRCI